jgi:predicted CXXCH cytochrome family protein
VAILVDAAGGRRTYQVVRTHGGGSGWKQRYHVRVGSYHYILPIQWNEAPRQWVAYNPQNWFSAGGTAKAPGPAQSYEHNCVGCHSTGLQVAHDAAKITAGVRYTEGNIGCESCHGPGSTHTLSKDESDIFNPRRLLTKTSGVFDFAGNLVETEQARQAYQNYLRANETCGQCHDRGVSNAAASYQTAFADGTHEYPYIHARGERGAYRVGEPLSWYYAERPGRWGDTRYDYVNSSKQHHQQWADMVEAVRDSRSGMNHAKNPFDLVSCFDCHNPHGSSIPPQLRQTSTDNTLCLSCHGGYGPFAPGPGETIEDAARRHGKHVIYSPGGSGSSRCTGCHMVRTAKSAVDRDISSHTFAVVVPQESRDMKAAGAAPIPNTCDGCHRNDSDLGVFRFEFYFGQRSPVTP